MTGLMIVTLIVSLLACIAVFVVVDSLANSVLKRMKKEVFRYIKQYNEQMQKDEGQAQSLEETAATATAVLPEAEDALAIPFVPKAQPMQKKDFFRDYRKVRDIFRAHPEQVIEQIPAQDESIGVRYRLVTGILDKLSFDNLYEICCLASEKQLLVLEDILEEDEKTIVSEYCDNVDSIFDCAKFHTYLKNKQAEYDDTIYCFAGTQEGMKKSADERVKPCTDKEVLEGFQLLHGGYLYDYGVRSSELR